MVENLEDKVIRYIQDHPKGKRKFTNIVDAFSMDENEQIELSKLLDSLVSRYVLFKSENGQYQTREQIGAYEGKISIALSGMGYIDREDRESIRIASHDQNTALNGDIVLVRCQPWQMYGEVITVLKRAKEHVIGTIVKKKNGLRFVPDDEKLKERQILLKKDDDFTLIEGMKVVCIITSYGVPLCLKAVECIGYKDDPGIDILSSLIDHDIRIEFPEEVNEQVKMIPQNVLEEDKKGRTDLTHDITVTIDGDSSKDFDDAVSVVKNEKGYVLKVSIADVSHYVQEDSPLDKEAYERGCSTYVTDRVVPMLPHELSNGICSLNPHVERLTLTCQMQIDFDGNIQDYSIYPSYIRSTERMTYHNVNLILDGDEKLKAKYAHLGSMLYDLRDCADAIRKQRVKKGAIAFNSTESEIIVDEEGHPLDVHPKQRGHAEEIIEDCMIAANVSVANFMKWQEIPSVYRIHEEPQAKRIKEFIRISELMGHKLIVGKSDIHPNEIQKYLDSVSDTPEYPVLSMLLLRCMQKAKYDSSCVGHFGLAEEEYLHFTSPIRRYPDLIVHRMLRKYSFEGCLDLSERKNDEEKCAESAEQSSIREKCSTDAEYDCDDMKKAEYMLDHLGEKAQGIITGVQSYGFYVQLENTVEGLVRITSLGDDYYAYDQDLMQLVGKRKNRCYRVGMKVNVMAIDANKQKGEVDFVLVGKNGKTVSQKRKTSTRHSHQRKERRKYHGRKKW